MKTEENAIENFFYPLIFPFKINNWFSRMWVLPIIAYIPIVDLILLRGWRLELVRRMGNAEEHILPSVNSPMDYVRFFKNGLVLWFMTAIYVGVPFVIIILSGTGVISGTIELLKALFDFFFASGSTQEVSNQLSDNAKNALIRLAIEGFWIVISAPFYRAGMIRYAFTKNPISFFRFLANAIFLFQQRNLFIKAYLFSITFGILAIVLTGLLAITGIGLALFPLVVLIVYYYSTGYEYGHLAHEVKNSRIV